MRILLTEEMGDRFWEDKNSRYVPQPPRQGMEKKRTLSIPLSCSGQKMCTNKRVGELNFLLMHVDDLFSLVLEILLACRKDPVFNPTSDLSSLSLNVFYLPVCCKGLPQVSQKSHTSATLGLLPYLGCFSF